MSSPASKTSHDAREEAYALPLDKIDMSQGHLFQNDIQYTGRILSGCTGHESRCAQRVLRRNRFLKSSLDGYSSKR